MPLLVKIPAAIRFVSYEPALEAVDFRPWLDVEETDCAKSPDGAHCHHWYDEDTDPCCFCGDNARGADLIIVGGESGTDARPFDLAWARSVVQQCDETGKKVFVKQLGKVRIDSDMGPDSPFLAKITGSKGDDPAQWLPMLRRQELPALPTLPAL